MYQATPIGTALSDVLNDLKDLRMVNDKQIDLFMNVFDKVMTAQLNALPDSETFSIDKSPAVDHKTVIDYRQIILQPAIIKFDDMTVTSPSLEVLAVKGHLKEEEKKKKRGR